MKLPKFTRYFVFSRVEPRDNDLLYLVNTCNRINAYMGCKTVTHRGRETMIGFIVLCGQRAYLRTICREFPNFNLVEMPSRVNNFGVFNEGFYDVVVGRHPYADVRKQLFEGDDDEGEEVAVV